jgi:hypothetical protein
MDLMSPSRWRGCQSIVSVYKSALNKAKLGSPCSLDKAACLSQWGANGNQHFHH